MSGRLLVTGASGLLGRRVVAQAAAAGWQVSGTYYRHPTSIAGVELLPLSLPSGVEELIARLQPAAVVHTAYLREPAQMWRVIVDGTASVARACRAVGARLIHLSSDAIFAGRPQPYSEQDLPEPIHPYGAAKAAAEALITALYPESLQIRTSLLYTAPGDPQLDPNRVMAHNLLQDPSRGRLFTDEIRCPLCVDDLAAAIVELVDRDVRGLLHIAGPVALSRYQFGRLLVRSVGQDPTPLPSGPARAMNRPGRVVLDSARACDLLATAIRSPYEVLGEDDEPPV